MKLYRKNPLLSSARLSFPLATAIAALFACQSAYAVGPYYWDNLATTGFGSAGGTWSGSASLWSNSSTGVGAAPGTNITTTTDALHFGTDAAGNGLGGGTITVSGTVDAASLRFGSQTTGNILITGGTINLAATTSIHVGAGGTTVHTIASNITGASTSLTKTGNSLILSGANSYTGSTIISSGTLTLGSTGALGSNPGVNGTSGVTIGGASAAILASSTDGITIAAPITTANTGVNSTISFGRSSANAGSIALNGAIGGNGNVIFTTPNVSSGGTVQTINLGSTSNNYAGTTTLNTGNSNNALTLKNSSGAANALPATTVLTFGTGVGTGSGRTTTFDLNGQNQTLAGLSNAGVVPEVRNQTVTSATAATLTINNTADFTFGGRTISTTVSVIGTNTRAQISGAISLVKNGAGTFTLGGTLAGGAVAAGNAFTGSTKVLGGILVLGESLSIQNSAFDTTSVLGGVSDGLRAGIGGTGVTTLSIGGLTGGNDFSTRFTTTTGGYSNLTALTLNPGTGVTHSYAADVGNGSGTGLILTKTTSGTQVFTAAQTYTGNTNVNGGTLQLSTSGQLGSGTYNANISVANTALLRYSSTVDQALGGIISGLGGITKDTGTASKLTLSGDNTYDGITAVSDGTLLINGNSSTANGAVNVTGGTLGGTGRSGGAVTVSATATLSPGASIESLDVASLSMASTSVFAYEVLDNGTAGADLLASRGTLSLTGVTLSLDAASLLALAGGGWTLGNKLTLISYLGADITSGFTGYADDTNYMFGSNEWKFNYNDTLAGNNFGTDAIAGGQDRFVTMTVVPEPRAALLGGLGLLALLRRRRD